MKTIEERREFFKKVDAERAAYHEQYWESADEAGFQVIITAHNEAQFLEGVLESVELGMTGTKWVMIFGDDGSTDSTLDIVKSFKNKSTANEYKIFSFDKAENVAKAKNRTVQKALKYVEEYKAILLTDADDKMGVCRSRGLYSTALSACPSSLIVLGAWKYCLWNKKEPMGAAKSLHDLTFGPWATIIHKNLIPPDGKLFYEGHDIHEDLILWRELIHAGIKITTEEKIETCFYNARVGSTSKPEDLEKRKKKWKKYKDFVEEKNLWTVGEKKQSLKDQIQYDSLFNLDPLAYLELPDGVSAVEVFPDKKSELNVLNRPGVGVETVPIVSRKKDCADCP